LKECQNNLDQWHKSMMLSFSIINMLTMSVYSKCFPDVDGERKGVDMTWANLRWRSEKQRVVWNYDIYFAVWKGVWL